jgi:DNA polymerase-3 subunit alpha
MQRDLLPDELDFQKRVFNFNKYLKTRKTGQYYVFDNACMEFFEKYFNIEELDIINGCTCILQTKWDKIYKNEMDAAREYLKAHQVELLQALNFNLFKEQWDKYAEGTLSSWEMDALCFYYNEHELAHVDTYKYGISNFFDMPTEPEVEKFFKRNGKEIPIYKTYKIIGTVISKNDARSSISLLTTEGVVNVKFTKEYYAMFGRQISEKQEDGTKKVMEKGWFQRGTKVMCTGFRRDDMFVTKSYAHTPTHQLYKITEVTDKGDIVLTHDRYGTSENEA